jgi:hypothetical protein
MSNEPNQLDNMDTENIDDIEYVEANDLKVGAGGRITIPEQKRERYGIEQGDWVDATFIVERSEEDS